MTADLISYLRRYRPGMTREEVATAAGVSLATLTRRLREGLDADEVMRAARAVGASPTEALLELGMLASDDVRTVAATDALDTVPERVLLEELLERAREREATEAADREEAGLPPAPSSRFEAAFSANAARVRRLPSASAARIDAAFPREVEASLQPVDEIDPHELGLAARRGTHDDE